MEIYFTPRTLLKNGNLFFAQEPLKNKMLFFCFTIFFEFRSPPEEQGEEVISPGARLKNKVKKL